MQAYCVESRTKEGRGQAEVMTMKNGGLAAQDVYPVCGN